MMLLIMKSTSVSLMAHFSTVGVAQFCIVGNNKAIVFGKVRITDILEPEAKLNKSEWQTAFNKVSRKHFDYVLCEPNSLSILAVVELDDQSHNTTKQKMRDTFVEGTCLKTGLALHRFKASNNHSVTSIQQQIFPEPPLADEPLKQTVDNTC